MIPARGHIIDTHVRHIGYTNMGHIIDTHTRRIVDTPGAHC